MREFQEKELKKLVPPQDFSKSCQVTIIGGSKLFHGAPLLSLKTASRIVSMVFFSSPEPSVGRVAEKFKSKLFSFIWVPWPEAGEYVKKSDAALIGSGLMRYQKEKKKVFDKAGEESKRITERFLRDFNQQQWVIDAGSLQVMDPKFIPQDAILTPNQKEFEMLFGQEPNQEPQALARKYRCLILMKGDPTRVYSAQESAAVKGGNAGMAKGGVGDVLAGLTVALAAKNPPFLATCAASFIAKKSGRQALSREDFRC